MRFDTRDAANRALSWEKLSCLFVNVTLFPETERRAAAPSRDKKRARSGDRALDSAHDADWPQSIRA